MVSPSLASCMISPRGGVGKGAPRLNGRARCIRGEGILFHLQTQAGSLPCRKATVPAAEGFALDRSPVVLAPIIFC